MEFQDADNPFISFYYLPMTFVKDASVSVTHVQVGRDLYMLYPSYYLLVDSF